MEKGYFYDCTDGRDGKYIIMHLYNVISLNTGYTELHKTQNYGSYR